MKNQNKLHIKNEYLGLNQKMYSILEPNAFKNAELVLLNKNLAKEVALDISFLESPEGVTFLSGNTNQYGPLYAQAYAGHQYGHFTMLGDGRAMVLGELDIANDKTIELQLKGSGRTPYSRGGDGKATLYSVLREYLISEAMNSLGISTTRSLAVLQTNEQIQRTQKEEGGILVRSASSHIRVGTFEYAVSYGGKTLVKELADFAINRHYKEINEDKDKYRAFLASVIDKQAQLIAKWQSVGFIHGVMNTDNMTISGETIDYGPCAFMNEYKPDTVFSSIDRNGRYAFNQQPFIGSWNLARFAETLLELLSDDKEEAVAIANQELEKYGVSFNKYWFANMAKKIGILDPTDEEKKLIESLLQLMEEHQVDYTNTFRLLTIDAFDQLPFYNTKEWTMWFQKWTRSLGVRKMDVSSRLRLMETSNPIVIPRNLLVEDALIQASTQKDYTLFNDLLEKLQHPYDYRKKYQLKYLKPKQSDEKYVTYCGT